MSLSIKKAKAIARKLSRKAIAEIFRVLIPAHFKRIIYLTTLYHFMRSDKPEVSSKATEDLVRLNEYLELAKTDASSLVLPGMLTDKLWHGNGGRLVTLTDDVLVARLLSRLPCWLNYGDTDTIAKDVVELRSFVVQEQSPVIGHK